MISPHPSTGRRNPKRPGSGPRRWPALALAALVAMATILGTTQFAWSGGIDPEIVLSEYSRGTNGGSCSGGRIDAIGVVFFGKAAGNRNTMDQIENHTDWDVGGPGGGGDGQRVWARTGQNQYACSSPDGDEANGHFWETRNHVRLWGIRYVPGTDERTVGTPHHEVVFGGKHCVPHDGFDKARHHLAKAFQRDGHETYTVNWGNTAKIKKCMSHIPRSGACYDQCNRGPHYVKAGSNGTVVRIRIDHKR